MIADCGAGWNPHATYFLRNWELCINCGADPLVRAGPPGPALLSTPSGSSRSEQADEGVGPRTRGSAPRFMRRCSAMEKVCGISIASSGRLEICLLLISPKLLPTALSTTRPYQP